MRVSGSGVEADAHATWPDLQNLNAFSYTRKSETFQKCADR
jgi:hypothetical protein